VAAAKDTRRDRAPLREVRQHGLLRLEHAARFASVRDFQYRTIADAEILIALTRQRRRGAVQAKEITRRTGGAFRIESWDGREHGLNVSHSSYDCLRDLRGRYGALGGDDVTRADAARDNVLYRCLDGGGVVLPP